MKLSPRMETIADLVREGEKTADIGTDHAYIPVYLVKNKVSDRVIATDVNRGPLENARNYIEKNELEDKIELRLGAGLEVIGESEVDTAIIAGMGGMLISEILEDSKEVSSSIKRFILQPMVGVIELRKYLYLNGYTVVGEKIAREGEKFYQIIVAEHGREVIEDEIKFEISDALIESGDKELKNFLEYKIRKLDNILKSIKEGINEDSDLKKKELESRKKSLMEVYQDVVR